MHIFKWAVCLTYSLNSRTFTTYVIIQVWTVTEEEQNMVVDRTLDKVV